MPYRILFAVASIDQVMIYSTQSILPIAVIGNIHYDTINDMAWMGNKMLAVASSDGFCSFIKIDSELTGYALPDDSEAIPEPYREYYKSLGQVNFQTNLELALQNKNLGF